ncbi:MAG: type II secretion system protein [Candidatus Gracilibacteria bacterium]|nr:type II secretion system protein [Candidatus Gracilibacteria bacterium]MDQ7022342.1 type II secretion system protein [Candidatus Gracilibacteria bacterium]
MKNKNKKAFTLIELIVVVTILVILSTVAFISLQNYTKYSRDAVRVNNLKTIESVFNIYQATESSFPEPTNPIDITYSGEVVWKQGIFGKDTRRLLGNGLWFSEIPLDPVTKSNYSYSLLNTKNKYQLASVVESSYVLNNLTTNTYADLAYVKTKIIGNNDCNIIKVQKGNYYNILAVPSLISSDLSETDLEEIINTKKLTYKGSSILPDSYKGSSYSTDDEVIGNIVNIDELLLFSGSLDEVRNSEDAQIDIINNLQKAYSGTLVENYSSIQNILNISDENKLYISQTLIKKCLISNFKVTASINIDIVDINTENINILFDSNNPVNYSCSSCN